MTCDRRTALGLLVAGGAAGTTGPLGAMEHVAGVPRAHALTVEWLIAPLGIDTLRPRFGWQLVAAAEVAQGRVVVGRDRAAVARGLGNIWDSGAVVPDLFRIPPGHDLPLQSHQACWWSVQLANPDGRWGAWSEPASFVTGMIGEPWPGSWIAAERDTILPQHARGQADPALVPEKRLPLLRGRVAIARPVTRAHVSIAGLGQYRLTINGHDVGDAALAPGWSEYRKRVLYDTWDVTGLVKAGDNVLAIMLGNGPYNVEYAPGRYTKFLDSYGAPKAIVALTIEHSDGTRTRFGTGADWRWTPGPILFSSMYGGEDWDARAIPGGWTAPGFDDAAWNPVEVTQGPGGVLRAGTTPPVRVVDTRLATTITPLADDVLLADFGYNCAGRPRLCFVAPAGTVIELVPGEALDADGRVTQASFNAGPGHAVLDHYTAAGGGEEWFEPAFVYHGMRYCEIRGLRQAALRTVECRVIRADVAPVGQFSASPALPGRIHDLIVRAADSNLMSVITDCPHREKLGWLEQTWLNAPTLFYNRDVITLYEKLVDDIADTQTADGMVPAIAPEYVAFVDAAGHDQIWRNSPEWGVAAVLAPWAAYRFCGDPTILARAWPAAERYCAYLAVRARDGLLDFGMGDWYDVGPRDPGEAQLTSRALVGTAVWIEALQAMAAIAPVIGRSSEVPLWQSRMDKVTAAFNTRFLDPATGRYEHGSQTAQAVPLALGIVPAAHKATALDGLVAAVRAAGNGVTAGDIGFRYVMRALAQAGRDDIVLAMLSVQGRPGYLWQLDHGATTLTEAWDANPTKSLNHFMLGHAEGWLYGSLAGLDIDHARPDAAALRIRPRMVPGIDRAAAQTRVPGGIVGCDWQRDTDAIRMTVTVPFGRLAQVCVPTDDRAGLRLDGRPLAASPGVAGMRRDGQALWLDLRGGRYRLEFPVPPQSLTS